MSNTSASLRRQIDSAVDLQSVVRTMKALAASGIGQYEASVRALTDYYRSVELGLGACFRDSEPARREFEARPAGRPGAICVVLFGSDQGLVGQFNEVLTDYAVHALTTLSRPAQVWAVGERVYARLADAGWPPKGLLAVPHSVRGIAPLVGQILIDTEMAEHESIELRELHLFYNRPGSAASYEPVGLRLLPLDRGWCRQLTHQAWPTNQLPQVAGRTHAVLRALIGEYLFICLFRACAESLASENASRLAAMERADKNIDELLGTLHGSYNRLRQSGIDEELFDVIAGFEALGGSPH
jgi:F-type H+-transporting ATPase subunit gamma